MREGRGDGDFSRFLRIEFERERLRSLERLTLSLDLVRRSTDPLRLFPSRSELRRLSRDFGRSFPSFSLESSFRAALRLFDLDCRRLRRSPPLLDEDDDEELLELEEDDELDELELSLELVDPDRFRSFRTTFSSFSFAFSTISIYRFSLTNTFFKLEIER